MKYKEEAVIPAVEFDRVNRLLAISNLEEMTDEELREAKANTYAHEGVFYVRFEDGSSLNMDLCSGSSNYYDDLVWTSPDGSRDVCLDCGYELDDVVFEVDGNTYIVKVIRYDNGRCEMRHLDLDIQIEGEEFKVYVREPESGELICLQQPLSFDEHPEFDKAIGDEIYSWLSLWADENDCDRDDE